jgi:hypothetical protein
MRKQKCNVSIFKCVFYSSISFFSSCWRSLSLPTFVCVGSGRRASKDRTFTFLEHVPCEVWDHDWQVAELAERLQLREQEAVETRTLLVNASMEITRLSLPTLSTSTVASGLASSSADTFVPLSLSPTKAASTPTGRPRGLSDATGLALHAIPTNTTYDSLAAAQYAIVDLHTQLEQAQGVVATVHAYAVEREGVSVDATRRLKHAERETEALQGMLESTMLMLDQDASALAETRRALQNVEAEREQTLAQLQLCTSQLRHAQQSSVEVEIDFRNQLMQLQQELAGSRSTHTESIAQRKQYRAMRSSQRARQLKNFAALAASMAPSSSSNVASSPPSFTAKSPPLSPTSASLPPRPRHIAAMLDETDDTLPHHQPVPTVTPLSPLSRPTTTTAMSVLSYYSTSSLWLSSSPMMGLSGSGHRLTQVVQLPASSSVPTGPTVGPSATRTTSPVSSPRPMSPSSFPSLALLPPTPRVSSPSPFGSSLNSRRRNVSFKMPSSGESAFSGTATTLVEPASPMIPPTILVPEPIRGNGDLTGQMLMDGPPTCVLEPVLRWLL